jgi:hypothetical protein
MRRRLVCGTEANAAIRMDEADGATAKERVEEMRSYRLYMYGIGTPRGYGLMKPA